MRQLILCIAFAATCAAQYTPPSGGGGGSPTGAAGGDLSGTYPNPGVAKINSTSLAGLASGLLFNTTGTGVPSIATSSQIITGIGAATISNNYTWSPASAATSGSNNSSPTVNLTGNYWNGSSSNNNTWTIQNVTGSGTNGESSLVFSYSGSSYFPYISFPNVSGGVNFGGFATYGPNTGTGNYIQMNYGNFVSGAGSIVIGGNFPMVLAVNSGEALRIPISSGYGLRWTSTTTVGSLPSCASATLGLAVEVTDATLATPGSTAVGSGTYTIRVQCIYNSTGSVYTWIID